MDAVLSPPPPRRPKRSLDGAQSPQASVSRAYPTALRDSREPSNDRKQHSRKGHCRHSESSEHTVKSFLRIPPSGASGGRTSQDPNINHNLRARLREAEREEHAAHTRRLLGDPDARPDYTRVKKERAKAFGAKNVEVPRELLERLPANYGDRNLTRKTSGLNSISTASTRKIPVKQADDPSAIPYISVPGENDLRKASTSHFKDDGDSVKSTSPLKPENASVKSTDTAASVNTISGRYVRHRFRQWLARRRQHRKDRNKAKRDTKVAKISRKARDKNDTLQLKQNRSQIKRDREAMKLDQEKAKLAQEKAKKEQHIQEALARNRRLLRRRRERAFSSVESDWTPGGQEHGVEVKDFARGRSLQRNDSSVRSVRHG